MNFLQVILLPFSVLYDLATRLRNHLFDSGIRTCFSFDVPVISVGNLSVGGTGKTPAVEYLIRLLSDTALVTLSRGYGRATKGFRLAGPGDSARTIGDEPFQFYSKFPGIHVAVGEDRAMAIPHILAALPTTECIVLDDAYQHRTVRPDLNILLTSFDRLFYDDHVLPGGRLREARKGASRANMIVVTKCPSHLTSAQKADIVARIADYARGIPVFFSTINYETPVSQKEKLLSAGSPVILVTGIARASGLKSYITSHYSLFHHYEYSDHHRFTEKEILEISAMAKKEGIPVITTEKDYMRLKESQFERFWQEVDLYYLPIKMKFITDGSKFDSHVKEVFSVKHT